MIKLSRFAAAWLTAALLGSFGCGGGDGGEGGGGGSGDGGPASFTIELLESAVEVPTGGDGFVSVVARATEQGKLHPSLFLRLEGLPEGVTARPESISTGEGIGFVWLAANRDAPPVENIDIRLIATTLSGEQQEAAFLLDVIASSSAEECWDKSYGPLTGVASAMVGRSPTFSDLIVIPDGRLVGVGTSLEMPGWVAVWDSDGYPERNFGNVGVVTLVDLQPERVLPLASGGYLLAGKEPMTGVPAIALLLDGWNIDPEFGVRPLAANVGSVRSLAGVGSVLYASISAGGTHVLTRFDLSFTDVFPPVADGPAPSFSAFVPDGSIVAANRTTLFRFDANGNWDTTFAGNGRLGIANSSIGAIIPFGDDGGVLVGGSVQAEGSSTNAYVTRVVNGAIDPAFFPHLRWRWETAAQATVVDLVKLHDGGAALAYEDPGRMLEVVIFDAAGNPRTEYGPPGSEGVNGLPYLTRSPLAHLVVDNRRDLLVGFVANDDMVAVARCNR